VESKPLFSSKTRWGPVVFVYIYIFTAIGNKREEVLTTARQVKNLNHASLLKKDERSTIATPPILEFNSKS
jgi:hypothetical protein